MQPEPEQKPAIVRSIDDRVKEATYWHDKAVKAHNLHSSSNLRHAEALYNLHKDDNFKELGHESFAKYAYDSFGKSKQWALKLVRIHEVFVEKLKVDKALLEEVTFGKLTKLVSHVDENDVLKVLNEAKDLTQQQIDEKIKREQGLEPNETTTSDGGTRLTFKGDEALMDTIKNSLRYAKFEAAKENSTSEDKISNTDALEYICAHYTPEVGEDPREQLRRTVAVLERVHKIKITYVDAEVE